MRSLHTAFVLAAVVSGSLTTSAEARDRYREDRPCGPGFTNLLVPQGFFGSDFRPACRRHDAAYASGVDRRIADDHLQREMLSACRCSRFPLGCRMTARMMGVGTKLFGGLYRSTDAVNRGGRSLSRSLRSY